MVFQVIHTFVAHICMYSPCTLIHLSCLYIMYIYRMRNWETVFILCAIFRPNWSKCVTIPRLMTSDKLRRSMPHPVVIINNINIMSRLHDCVHQIGHVHDVKPQPHFSYFYGEMQLIGMPDEVRYLSLQHVQHWWNPHYVKHNRIEIPSFTINTHSVSVINTIKLSEDE